MLGLRTVPGGKGTRVGGLEVRIWWIESRIRKGLHARVRTVRIIFMMGIGAR